MPPHVVIATIEANAEHQGRTFARRILAARCSLANAIDASEVTARRLSSVSPRSCADALDPRHHGRRVAVTGVARSTPPRSFRLHSSPHTVRVGIDGANTAWNGPHLDCHTKLEVGFSAQLRRMITGEVSSRCQLPVSAMPVAVPDGPQWRTAPIEVQLLPWHERGHHRAPSVADLLLAATAEFAGLDDACTSTRTSSSSQRSPTNPSNGLSSRTALVS